MSGQLHRSELNQLGSEIPVNHELGQPAQLKSSLRSTLLVVVFIIVIVVIIFPAARASSFRS